MTCVTHNIIKYLCPLFLFLGIILLLFNSYCHFFITNDIIVPNSWNANLGYISIILIILGLLDIENIYEFSVGSITLKRKIKEADNTLDHLRELITPVSEVAMTVATRSNRMGIPPIEPRRLKSLKEKIEGGLKKIYLPEELDPSLTSERKKKLNEIFDEYHKFNLWDLAQPIYKIIDEELKKKADEIRKETTKYEVPIKIDEKWQELQNTLCQISTIKKDFRGTRQNLDFSDLKSSITEKIMNIPDNIFNTEEKKEIIRKMDSHFQKIDLYRQNASM